MALTSTLKCQACGTMFTVDLDRGDATCPQCGSSNTAPATSMAGVKKVITT